MRAIAEHAIALMLALRRRLHGNAPAGNHQWAQAKSRAVRSAVLPDSLLVVGLGTIGARVAAGRPAWGCA
jgi:lactate dehydrogenase-like 2-hydroxyacid dehydrogenase